MQRALILILALTCLQVGCSQLDNDFVIVPPTDVPTTMRANFAKLTSESVLTIVVPAKRVYRGLFWNISAGPATPEQVKDYTRIIVEELLRYSPAFIKHLQLEQVVLCSNLRRIGHPVLGLACSRENAIYLHTSYYPTLEVSEVRTTFHHELFHILDARNGDAYDTQWAALNPEGFYYGQDINCRTPEGVYQRPAGFINGHGQTNAREDKAVTYAFMMAEYAAIRDMAEDDDIVRAKADLIETIVADFHPDMGDAFWAEANRRSEGHERRITAAIRYGWQQVEPGVDPLAADSDPTKMLAIVRPTKFPDCHEYEYAPGKLTQLNVSWTEVIPGLYKTNLIRCIIPDELNNQKCDFIVSLPGVEEQFAPRIWDEARKAFEAQCGFTARKETREVDAYVIRLGDKGTTQLERLAKNNPKNKAEPDKNNWWQRLWSNDKPLPESIILDDMEGPAMGLCSNTLVLRKIKMEDITGALEWLLDHPVIEETGFTEPISTVIQFDSKQYDDRTKTLEDALGVDVTLERREVEMTVLEKQ